MLRLEANPSFITQPGTVESPGAPETVGVKRKNPDQQLLEFAYGGRAIEGGTGATVTIPVSAGTVSYGMGFASGYDGSRGSGRALTVTFTPQ